MLCNLHTTVSFTGHRSYAHQADESLASVLYELYMAGFRLFLSGMARGFDLAAAETVLRLRHDLCPEIRLGCAIPFEGQEQRFPTKEQIRYRNIRAQADEEVVLCPGYQRDCYRLRNNLLVERAAVLVAWYDGSEGGTHYTIHRAARLGRRICNLCTSPHENELPGLF